MDLGIKSKICRITGFFVIFTAPVEFYYFCFSWSNIKIRDSQAFSISKISDSREKIIRCADELFGLIFLLLKNYYFHEKTEFYFCRCFLFVFFLIFL